jgi:hypothetical protein
MKIRLSELRQIVKSIIKEEMETTPATTPTATPSTKTDLDILAQTLSAMKPTIQKGVSGVNAAKITLGDKISIDSQGKILFNKKYLNDFAAMRFITKLLGANKLIIQMDANGEIPVKINLKKPNEIKTALEQFFQKFPK